MGELLSCEGRDRRVEGREEGGGKYDPGTGWLALRVWPAEGG